ncbi:MAG: pentapeptide repeat-containing protein [Coleofasciculus chthonoplastes F3-SA18-01]|uniref:pentapeptide repeat-containing protein n=1 Tax=Coleofasciculus chthonoplastes TaxID=64178 RepID=UPI0032FFF8C1
MSANESDDLRKLRLWLVRLVVGFIALVVLAVLPFLWWLNVTPIQQQQEILDIKDFFELRNQAIKSVITSVQILATVFGGIAILFNVYYGAKRAKAFEKNAIAATQNAIAATQNAEIAEQGQITERFTKAIEQLGSDNISIRLGGIYALERIAKDSERDHWTIMEVLSAFVRENAPLKEDLGDGNKHQPQKLRTDIQAALTVIGQRDTEKDPENQKLDLSNADIAGANLTEANLQDANLTEANLQGAKLFKANLQGAKLFKANLEGAFLWEAKLQDAVLQGARLREANLFKANLEGAFLCQAKLPDSDLREANLKRTNFGGANLYQAVLFQANLERANLNGAILQEANFRETNLQGADFGNANLNEANLQGADIGGSINLTLQQIKSAIVDDETRLLYGLERLQD